MVKHHVGGKAKTRKPQIDLTEIKSRIRGREVEILQNVGGFLTDEL